MKKIIFILCLILSSCGGFSVSDIEKESQPTILKSMSETLNIEADDIKVNDYTLVQESDNVYTGILETTYNGMSQTWDIKVVWDHKTDKYTVEWELKNAR